MFFAATFIVLNAAEVITLAKIELWLDRAQSTSKIWVAAIVAGLLFLDLFVAVPTLTLKILGGYFLGPVLGAGAAIIGFVSAGTCGYAISKKYGNQLARYLVKNEQDRNNAFETFRVHGPVMILLSRASPILPEVTACMAGLTNMRFGRFILFWLASTVPYALIASYAGSISTIQNPLPAILTAVGLTTFFWLGWFLFNRFNRTNRNR